MPKTSVNLLNNIFQLLDCLADHHPQQKHWHEIERTTSSRSIVILVTLTRKGISCPDVIVSQQATRIDFISSHLESVNNVI